ncbi:MAG: signal recognition particle-docking protein FtsY [Candidatus Brocadiaceae bacterium]|nr:signal recognition particle-docking protein FtsY [Candidatus Brocadiaceae bacterium]
MVFDLIKGFIEQAVAPAGVKEEKKEEKPAETPAEKTAGPPPPSSGGEEERPTEIPVKKQEDSSWLSLDAWVSLDDLKKGLEKTRARLEGHLQGLFALGQTIDEHLLEEIEAALIEADMGVKPVGRLMEELRRACQSGEVTDAAGVKGHLKARLKERFKGRKLELNMSPTPPTVIMVAGVNGSGKTTSIAKLGYMFAREGKQVLLAAGDTFRAAAVEQLEIWAGRIGAQIIKHQTGADPSAVAYDALEAAVARGVDVVIVDTAGRLHTKQNLMSELGKMKKVLSKRIEHAPHEVLLVLDATTGQNAISQARLFKEAVDITGIFLAKLDGTAKGGVVLGMQDEIKIPVKFVGLGEKAEDIQRFDPEGFIDALFD